MSTYLIKFILKQKDSEKNIKRQVFTPNKEKGGIPADILNQIPFFQPLLIPGTFSDSLKPSPEINEIDLSNLELSSCDVAEFFQAQHQLIQAEKLFKKPSRGTLKLADYFHHVEVQTAFIQQFKFDYEEYLLFDDNLLSMAASDYLDKVFCKISQDYVNIINKIYDIRCDGDYDIFDREDELIKLFKKLKAIVDKRYQLLVEPNQQLVFKFKESFENYLKFIDDVLEFFETRKSFDYSYFCQEYYTNYENTNNIHYVQFYLLIVELVNTYNEKYDNREVVRILKKDPTWSEKIRFFVNHNPGIAQLIWETEDFRNKLIIGYLKITNRKRRRFMDARFVDLIPLVENRIGPDSIMNKIDKKLAEILDQDSTLIQLYKEYNRHVNIVNSGYKPQEDFEIVWNKIVSRTQELCKKYQSNRQKIASRGLQKAGWYE